MAVCYIMREIPIEERFWKHVDISGEDNCWNWTGSMFQKGYGCVKYKGKLFGAHRISYMIHNGGIPDKLFICHTCDNRRCVNPKHLYAGTAADNSRDMVERKRFFKGKRRSVAPLGTKWCSQCSSYLPVEDFTKNRSCSDGLDYYCKKCHNRIETNKYHEKIAAVA